MTRAHLVLTTFVFFRKGIEESKLEENARKHLTTLCKIFATEDLHRDCVALYQCGYFQKTQSAKLLEFLKAQIKEIRPFIIPLVEAFAHHDHSLNSAIGNSYGDIYESQLDCARNSLLNKVEIKGMKEFLSPLLSKDSKL